MPGCSLTSLLVLARVDSYVPIKVDYSDLYDAMTFFRGGPDGNNGHDELGKKIGTAGKEWARDHVSLELAAD